MTRTRTSSISAERTHIAVVSAFSILVILGALYIYFVSMTVAHVVMRKEVMREINHLHTEVSQLEASYIDTQHGMANEIATLEGFHEVSDKIFINRTDTSVALRSIPLQ